MKSLVVWIGLLASALFILAPQHASASSLFEHSRTEVPAGQTVDNVYVVGGDTDILGHITGAVVVINGNLHLGPDSSVGGAVVVIGGTIKQDPGAITSNDINNFSLDAGTQNSLLIGGGMIAGVWILQLAGTLLIILVPVLIRLIGRNRAAAWIRKTREEASWKKSLSLGALSAVILAAFSLLCIFTVFGIPLLMLVIVILLAAFIFGITSVGYRVGGLIQGKWVSNEWIRLIAGASLIAAFSNIPLVGGILLFLILLLSLGDMVQWLSGLKRKKPAAGK